MGRRRGGRKGEILSAINRLYRTIPCACGSVDACVRVYVCTSEPNPVEVRQDSLLVHTDVHVCPP